MINKGIQAGLEMLKDPEPKKIRNRGAKRVNEGKNKCQF